MADLQILTPDGKRRLVPLASAPLTLGRAPGCELSYPDDGGLSRQHLIVEPHETKFFLTDLGSKNGTVLNGTRVSGRVPLSPGDRMMAGHLILTLVSDSSRPSANSSATVVFTEADAGPATVTADLSQLIQGKARPASTPISALIRAGNELSGERPLPELFPLILSLAIDAVQAERGVLFTLEGETLHLQASRGESFRISSSVRDRVLQRHESILVRDTTSDEAFRESRSIVHSNIRTLMAVPLQTRDCMVGLLYVDSPSLIRHFSEDDLNLLTVMANVAAIRIEQSRFAEREKTREVLERELEQAASIQRQYLPTAAPQVQGLD
ncbi:MAG: FHA domain-containing protein, partial [Acidobacteriota bacterium]|nr:FHA domain-containing protein [Acidobacteriota bacterium]